MQLPFLLLGWHITFCSELWFFHDLDTPSPPHTHPPHPPHPPPFTIDIPHLSSLQLLLLLLLLWLLLLPPSPPTTQTQPPLPPQHHLHHHHHHHPNWPLTIDHWQLTIDNLQFTIHNVPLTIHHFSSTIDHWSLAIDHWQLPIDPLQLYIGNCLVALEKYQFCSLWFPMAEIPRTFPFLDYWNSYTICIDMHVFWCFWASEKAAVSRSQGALDIFTLYHQWCLK